jgi:2'-5' RNA ligase
LWPDEPTRQQLLRETRQMVRRCGGKPVPPANYHVTVAFVGTLLAERFNAIAAAGRAIEFAQFELLFDRVGYWPRPRVLWAAPSRCPPELNTLVSMLWDRLSDAGLEREARAYQPHLTLCRKLGRPVEAKLAKPVRWSASGFVLVESAVVDGRSSYRVVERFGQ